MRGERGDQARTGTAGPRRRVESHTAVAGTPDRETSLNYPFSNHGVDADTATVRLVSCRAGEPPCVRGQAWLFANAFDGNRRLEVSADPVARMASIDADRRVLQTIQERTRRLRSVRSCCVRDDSHNNVGGSDGTHWRRKCQAVRTRQVGGPETILDGSVAPREQPRGSIKPFDVSPGSQGRREPRDPLRATCTCFRVSGVGRLIEADCDHAVEHASCSQRLVSRTEPIAWRRLPRCSA